MSRRVLYTAYHPDYERALWDGYYTDETEISELEPFPW
jgi:hypothetical protein